MANPFTRFARRVNRTIIAPIQLKLRRFRQATSAKPTTAQRKNMKRNSRFG